MKRFIEDYTNKKYDILIIGGGITGAAVAYDAATRGLSVALLEKGDFGSATSSATSKMIHGGLRYLANMEVGLVRESLRERKTLENIAPNFVYPMPVMYTNNKLHIMSRKFIFKFAMLIYDVLSFDKSRTWDKNKKLPIHTTISRKKVMQKEPNVKKENLVGASIYYDCVNIFPERLTLSFIKSAVTYGAHVANYAQVKGFLKRDNKIQGVVVTDMIRGKTVKIRSKITINCGGPWADIILGIAQNKSRKKTIKRSEGIHIITKKLIKNHIVTSSTAEGRHFFLIPWRNRTIIGTTDKEYIGKPDDYKVTHESIMELLKEVNTSFGNDLHLTEKDIHYVYGGLRPLVEEQSENVYESSRKYEIYDNARDGLDGLITVEGGKYTTSRNLAEQVMKIVTQKMNWYFGTTITDKQYLRGSEINDINRFIKEAKKDNSDFDKDSIDYLARIYGTEFTNILALARKKKYLKESLNSDGEMLAQVLYAIRNEMAFTLSDIIFRRTGIGTCGHPGEKVLNRIADFTAKELKWNIIKKNEELDAVNRKFKTAIS